MVEFKLFAFKDISVTASGLSWAGGNASENSSGVELLGNLGVNDSGGNVLLDLGSKMSRLLALSSGLVGLLNLFLVELNIVMLKIPQSEWIGINGDNAVLDNGLGSNELIVGSVVDDIQNSSLSSDTLRSPGEVTCINLKGSILIVSSSNSDWSNSLWAQFGACGWSSHFELSLLLMNWHTSTSGSSLVSRVSVNSHDPYESIATLYNNNEQINKGFFNLTNKVFNLQFLHFTIILKV